jgi:hypothetical protein
VRLYLIFAHLPVVYKLAPFIVTKDGSLETKLRESNVRIVRVELSAEEFVVFARLALHAVSMCRFVCCDVAHRTAFDVYMLCSIVKSRCFGGRGVVCC